jgi:hypothetical protein
MSKVRATKTKGMGLGDSTRRPPLDCRRPPRPPVISLAANAALPKDGQEALIERAKKTAVSAVEKRRRSKMPSAVRLLVELIYLAGARLRNLSPCPLTVTVPRRLRRLTDFVDRGVWIDAIDQAQGSGDRL